VEPEQESTSLSPRAARSAKEGAAASTSRRRPSLPSRGKKAAATAAPPQPTESVADGAAESPKQPISWLAMETPAAVGPHVAMPRLMGQPAYARPPRPLAVESPRPIDADDLPIEAFRSEEDHELAERLAHAGSGMRNGYDVTMHPSSVGGLRAIAGRLFGRG
jgi:hypothetical protein